MADQDRVSWVVAVLGETGSADVHDIHAIIQDLCEAHWDGGSIGRVAVVCVDGEFGWDVLEAVRAMGTDQVFCNAVDSPHTALRESTDCVAFDAVSVQCARDYPPWRRRGMTVWEVVDLPAMAAVNAKGALSHKGSRGLT